MTGDQFTVYECSKFLPVCTIINKVGDFELSSFASFSDAPPNLELHVSFIHLSGNGREEC